MGNIGFDIIKKNGSVATINDIQNIHQTLNPWTGEIHSEFTIENIPVDVITYCHQQQDAIAVKIISPLLREQRLASACDSRIQRHIGQTWETILQMLISISRFLFFKEIIVPY